MKKNLKLILFFLFQLLVVTAIILTVMIEGNKTYTVTFDLNGGTLIRGSLVQKVKPGQSAVPPEVIKDGSYLLEWSDSYTEVRGDVTASAVWDYETSLGVQFEYIGNYCLVSGSYEGLSGDVYIGAMSNGVPVLGVKKDAFKNRENITAVYLSEGMMSIGESAFEGCTNLKTLVIPSTVTTIGDNLLKNTLQIEELSVPFIGNGFYGGSDIPLYRFFSVSANYDVPGSLKTLTVTGDYKIPAHAFHDCEYIERIIIEGNVELIEIYAFAYCNSLKEVVLPESLKTVNYRAFIGTSLESITIPDNVEELIDGCFANSPNLTSVTLGTGMKRIAPTVFQNCPLLTEFIIPQENDSVEFKDGKLYVKNESELVELQAEQKEYLDAYRKKTVTYYDKNGKLVGTERVTVYDRPRGVTVGYVLFGDLYSDREMTEPFSSIIIENIDLYGDFRMLRKPYVINPPRSEE